MPCRGGQCILRVAGAQHAACCLPPMEQDTILKGRLGLNANARMVEYRHVRLAPWPTEGCSSALT